MNNYVYRCPGTSIEEGPSLEYEITDAIDAPIGTQAEIFSGGLPNELWTMVFENLSQHDLPSCLRVSHKWFELANDHRLWKDLDLTNACVNLQYPLGYHAPRTLLDRIEDARSISVRPEVGRNSAGFYNNWARGEDLAGFLRTRKSKFPLPNLRILTIRCISWNSGLTKYLPNLTELDMTRIVVDFDLCGVIQQLSPSLKRLRVDRLRLCPGFFAVVTGFSKLEYLSISACGTSSGGLKWFMTGLDTPRRVAGCRVSAHLFESRAGTVMPLLRDLDFAMQTELDFELLHAFHELRLHRLPAYMRSTGLDPARMRPHPININLVGCDKMRHYHLTHLERHFPGTRTTPRMKPRGAPFSHFHCGMEGCSVSV